MGIQAKRLILEDYVTVGHRAVIHSAHIEDWLFSWYWSCGFKWGAGG